MEIDGTWNVMDEGLIHPKMFTFISKKNIEILFYTQLVFVWHFGKQWHLGRID